MKKLLVLLTICAIVICLAGCGGSNSTNGSNTSEKSNGSKGDWSISEIVDEFGDVDENSEYVSIETKAQGDFSNTATAKSDLTVKVIFILHQGNTFGIDLLEYNETPATYLSGSELSMKIKIGEQVYDFTLGGTAPNGSLAVKSEEMYNALLDGKDIKCVVYIDSSQYNFTISANGFKETYDKANEIYKEKSTNHEPADANTLVKQYIRYYLLDTSAMLNTAATGILAHADALEVISQHELANVLNGNNFLQITSNNYWTIEKYSDNNNQQIAFLKENTAPKGREYEDTSDEKHVDEFKIENGYIVKEIREEPEEGKLLGEFVDRNFQLRKVCDDVYILFLMDENENIEGLDSILIKYNNKISSTEDLNVAIQDIITNVLGLPLEEE